MKHSGLILFAVFLFLVPFGSSSETEDVWKLEIRSDTVNEGFPLRVDTSQVQCAHDNIQLRFLNGTAIAHAATSQEIAFKAKDADTYYLRCVQTQVNLSNWTEMAYWIWDDFDDGVISPRWEIRSPNTEDWVEENGEVSFQNEDGEKGWLVWSGMNISGPIKVHYRAKQANGWNPSADVGFYRTNISSGVPRVMINLQDGIHVFNSSGNWARHSIDVKADWYNISWKLVPGSDSKLSVYGPNVNTTVRVNESSAFRGIFGLFGNSGAWADIDFRYVIRYDDVRVEPIEQPTVELTPLNLRNSTIRNTVVRASETEEVLKAVSMGYKVAYGSGEIGYLDTTVSVEELGDTLKTRCARKEHKPFLATILAENDSVSLCGAESRDRTSFETYRREKLMQHRDINHLVVTRPGMADVGAAIAADQDAFLVVANVSKPAYAGVAGPNVSQRNALNGVPVVKDAIQNATRLLGEYGMFLEGESQYTDGLYISLIGVPHILKNDPVEAAEWSLADPADRDYFMTDLPYGDLDGDGRIDAAVGRYPDDKALASRMYLRSIYYEDNKKALVASEYLHPNWPTILTYIGGGMWAGKSMEHILEGRGYAVDRAVEYRSDPAAFLESLTPVNVQAAMDDSSALGNRVGAVLGDSVGAAAGQAIMYVKALHYVEQGLEQYLEFEWSTFGLDIDRANSRLGGLNISDPEFLFDTVKDARDRAQEKNRVKDSFVAALDGENIQMAISQVVYAFLWPDRYSELTETYLRNNLAGNSIIYYEGVGNGSAWHLPNEFSYLTPLEQIKTDRYNGSHAFDAQDIPSMTPRIVFDNSDVAARSVTTRPMLWHRFLEQGAASYIGTSSVNYAPFSSEIDTRFFKHGYTTGESLRQAVNAFREDRLTWDPVNTLARRGVKDKMLHSFVLYGNPEQWKDPVIEEQLYTLNQSCDGTNCTLAITIDVNHTITTANGTRYISAESNGKLLESFQPIIPLIKAEHYLPAAANVTFTGLSYDTETAHNVTVPIVEPLAHGNTSLNATNLTAPYFPQNGTRITLNDTLDDRTRLHMVQAAYAYNTTAKTATLYDNITARFRYTSPVTLRVAAEDTSTGTDAGITLIVQNNADRDIPARFRVRIGNATTYTTKTLQRNITKQAETRVPVPFTPTVNDSYRVDAFLFAEDLVLGPRTTSFAVWSDEVLRDRLGINELHPAPANGSEFVELVNPSRFPVTLDRIQLRDAANNTAVLNGTLPAHGYRTVPAPSLNNDEDSLTLEYCPRDTRIDAFQYDTSTPGTMILANGSTMNTSLNRTVTGRSGLHITALAPDTEQDWNGNNVTQSDDDEFVQIRNGRTTTADLSTYYIADAAGGTRTLTGTLAPNETVTVFQPPALNNGGDTVTLYREQECVTLDQTAYQNPSPDRSIGRYPDTTGDYVRMVPSPEAPNQADLSTASEVSHLIINEIAPEPFRDQGEYIELYNPADTAIGIDGVWLRDAAGNEVSLTGRVQAGQYRLVTPPALNNDGDTIELLHRDTVVTTAAYESSSNGKTVSRSPDRTRSFRFTTPTPGAQNPHIIERVIETEASSSTTDSSSDSGGGGFSGLASAPEPEPEQVPFNVSGPLRAGAPFSVEVAVPTDGAYTHATTYAYQGSEPLTMSRDGDASWGAITANVSAPGEVLRLNGVIEPNVTGTVNLAVRLTGDDEKRVVRTMNVSAAPTLAVEHVPGEENVSIQATTDCDMCTVTLQAPGTNETQYVEGNATMPRTPGTYTVALEADDYTIATERFTVEERQRVSRDRSREPQRTPTGAIPSQNGGIIGIIAGLLDVLVFW